MKKVPSLAAIRDALRRQGSPKYDRETFLWGPDVGDPILAKDLDDLHLANIINWIIDNDSSYADAVRDFMIGEAEYRALIGFANNTPIIQRGEDGRYRVINNEK